jgi:riboflavin biosynthesis pyrimidine reductase
MGPSIDGRIVTTKWGSLGKLTAAYDRTAASFGADAWMAGRISMEPYAGKARIPRRTVKHRIPRKDFAADRNARSYAIALDPAGKLRWESGVIDDEHVITILTERVSDDYLAFLQSKGISYVFGGKTKIDLQRALAKLRTKFGIRKLLLEGGGSINGSFLNADLIDELSVLIVPVADGSIGAPTLFDAREKRAPTRKLRLLSVRRIERDMIWVRYKIR